MFLEFFMSSRPSVFEEEHKYMPFSGAELTGTGEYNYEGLSFKTVDTPNHILDLLDRGDNILCYRFNDQDLMNISRKLNLDGDLDVFFESLSSLMNLKEWVAVSIDIDSPKTDIQTRLCYEDCFIREVFHSSFVDKKNNILLRKY